MLTRSITRIIVDLDNKGIQSLFSMPLIHAVHSIHAVHEYMLAGASSQLRLLCYLLRLSHPSLP
ncbi:hypothetical protein SAMN05216316_0565 [Nitrosovibrio sp. Nv6]|nr:hypothetical protein SAMN05216316_0565 [Nitrosovibrio sp. Nv6]